MVMEQVPLSRSPIIGDHPGDATAATEVEPFEYPVEAQGGQYLLLHANESGYIPAGAMHRLSQTGTADLVIIEIPGRPLRR
jgi:Mannose-6-phosphate isomerase